MPEEKKLRLLATQASSKVPKMVRADLGTTLTAKAEGKKVA
jgi:hypothetical protein